MASAITPAIAGGKASIAVKDVQNARNSRRDTPRADNPSPTVPGKTSDFIGDFMLTPCDRNKLAMCGILRGRRARVNPLLRGKAHSYHEILIARTFDCAYNPAHEN
jgi:hypothetical protein